jgi:predicted  nucleic acid-binding Zn-ribbon protein
VPAIQSRLDTMAKAMPRLGELAKKARSVKKHGADMENELTGLQNDLERELQQIMQQLDRDQVP